MATQLKHADLPPIPVQATGNYTGYRAARPNIRVAFSAGAATLAIRDKLAGMPDAGKTLEEIAAASPYDGLSSRDLLAERNAIMARINDGPAVGDAEIGALCSTINEIERELLGREALTPDDAIVSLVAAVQIAAEGHELDDEEAARALIKVRRHFGIGYVHQHLLDNASPPTAVLPDNYDPFMRGAYIAWQKAYDRYTVARAEQRTFYDTMLIPAIDRYNAVRGAWPCSHEFANDPIGTAALAAVDYEALQLSYDDLVSVEHQALLALLKSVAPSPSELATKLQLVVSEEAYTFIDLKLFQALAADGRRFGRHGAIVQHDKEILDAFAKRRAEAAYWLQPSAEEGDEIEVRSNAVVYDAEAVLFGARASTIEGVVAKLRALFPHYSQLPYSDRATVDPSHPDFKAGLVEDDGNEQVLWACIEDLARIGGVNLAEQGR